MKFFVKIVDKQPEIEFDYFESWQITEIFCHSDTAELVTDDLRIMGLMSIEPPVPSQEYPELAGVKHYSLPDTFYDRELKKLAYGSREEIVEVSEKYGLLTSPFAKNMHWEMSYFSRNLGYFKQKRELDKGKEIIERVANGIDRPDYSPRKHPNEYSGIKETKELALHQISRSIETGKAYIAGNIVSFPEIRATALALRSIFKTIVGISKGLSTEELANEWSKCKDYGIGFPIENFKFLNKCIESIPRHAGILLVDEFGKRVESLDAYKKIRPERTADRKYLFPSRIEGDVLNDAAPKSVTLTEAIAINLHNLKAAQRAFAECDNCGDIFPLRAGQLRNREAREGEPKPGKYCSGNCKAAAGMRRTRQNRLALKKQSEQL